MLAETDKYLLESINEGDYKAFEVLFTSYYSPLCKYAFSFVNSAEIAEDIVSDFFMKLWESPISISIATNLKGYLFRSIHNSCLNYLTRTQKNFLELDSITIEKLNSLIPASKEDDHLGMLMVAELEEMIGKSINQLPKECGKIFTMSRREGLSHRDISEKLNISENTVKVQIYRALAKIRKMLDNY